MSLQQNTNILDGLYQRWDEAFEEGNWAEAQRIEGTIRSCGYVDEYLDLRSKREDYLKQKNYENY